MGHIIDNGETVVDRAGRIHTQFEGKGLVKYMSQYLLDWGISKGVNAIAFTITDGSAYLSRESFQRTTKYILTKVFIYSLTLCTLGKNFRRRHFEKKNVFLPENRF